MTHKATLVNALSRVIAERVSVQGIHIGRKGFVAYLKALSGSNTVKIVPSTSPSTSLRVNSGQVPDGKRLRVVCGANTSYLEESQWIGDKTPMTLCELRVSPDRIVKPNIGNAELAEALSRVLPFTAREDNRPVLQCVLFRGGEGKLTMASADGFRLAVVNLDCDCGKGEALILRDDLWGIASALRKAKRVCIGFDKSPDGSASSPQAGLDGMCLIIDTEAIRYKWLGADRQFPEYEKLMPIEFATRTHFDSVEALKALASLKVLSDAKEYPIDLGFNGKLVMSTPDENGRAEMPADTEGESGTVRLQGDYLSQALKACGGMVDFSFSPDKPAMFEVDGFKVVTMPMFREDKTSQPTEAKPAEQSETEAKAPSPDGVGKAVSEAEKANAVAEAEAIATGKTPKRKHKARRPVAVA